MFTIGKLARDFRMSRSTLLYYDSIGLLSPSQRTNSNYRLYSDGDYQRLKIIMLYREAGISLEKIKEILETDPSGIATQLQMRFEELNEEIQLLRDQQRYVISLLQNINPTIEADVRMKAFHGVSALSGVSEETRWRFHNRLETAHPAAHQEFLEMLGFDPEEIQRCRKWSQDVFSKSH